MVTLRQAVSNPINSIMSVGRRVFEPQPSSSLSEQDLMDALNSFQGVSFDKLGDFFRYYKEDYFRTAYTQLDPFSCHQLAISNPWIASAVNAIAKSIASADIVATPKDKENPNELEEEYINLIMSRPNKKQTAFTFKKLVMTDLLQTGRAYLEVAYNDYGYPCALYRIAPYKIKAIKVNGIVYHIRDNGYVFPEGSLIPIFNPNPFTDDDGLSPLVALFTKIMLDEAVTEHNLRYFVNDVLKGLMSYSDKMNYDEAMKEVDRIQKKVVEMREKGQSGHLVTYGATFQALNSNNRDMMTPEIENRIIDAVKAVYHVPPQKMSLIESGNLGGGTGESQDEMMNETLNDWATLLLSYLDTLLLEFAGITDTTLEFVNLTKSDEMAQAKLDTENLNNGTTHINEVRLKRGDDPYEDEIANEPLVNSNRVPLSKIGTQPALAFTKPIGDGSDPPPEPATPPGEVNQLMQKVRSVFENKNLKGTYVIKGLKP